MNIANVIQNTIARIVEGKTVPIKKEFQQTISEELDEKGVTFTVKEDETNEKRVLFKAAKVITATLFCCLLWMSGLNVMADELPIDEVECLQLIEEAPFGEEAECFQLINEFRASNGLPALIWSRELAKASRDWSDTMRRTGRWGHGAGYENIYRGSDLGERAFNGWKRSAPHRAFLLSRSTVFAGVGVSGNFWTFRARPSLEPAPVRPTVSNEQSTSRYKPRPQPTLWRAIRNFFR